MGRVIKLIQFLDDYSDTGDEGEACIQGEFKYVHLERDSYEFYDGEDDDGDSIYNDRTSISFTNTEAQAIVGTRLSYVPKDEITYSILEIELEEA
jgi:hypothetical protein